MSQFFGSLCTLILALSRTNASTLTLYVLTTIFPGELRLAGFVEAKDDGCDGNNWSYTSCKAPVKLSPPTNQYGDT